MKKITLSVKGMVCTGCESVIEEAVSKLDGVEWVKADYPRGLVELRFDEDKISLEAIEAAIEASGYHVDSSSAEKKPAWLKWLLSLLAVILVVAIIIGARKLSHQFSLPDLNSHLSDGMVFLVGLITGLHCIGMCGGFVLSYTARDAELQRPSWVSHILYGLGKTLSYAMFGGLFGLLGALISITPFMQGVTNLIAGGFLLLFGLNMLDVFAPLKRIRIKQPEAMTRFVIERRKRARSPFFIGFFTGFLLGCGPLQTMYVLAAGTGDPWLGAKFLALFSLGTLPALWSFGYLTRLFSAAATHRFFQLSGVILIFIGLMMLNKGLMRTHSGYDFKSIEHHIESQWQKIEQNWLFNGKSFFPVTSVTPV